MSKKYHHGGYHGTVISGGQVIQSGSGGAYTSGNGGSTVYPNTDEYN